jgi:glycine/D-amino acid oxidase-like deaminating enzyme
MSGSPIRVAVVGAGFFGCNTALALAEAGYEVLLLERLPNVLMGTSGNNTNRVHQGFHYPRDDKTALQCRDHYKKFEAIFPKAIVSGFPNIYCIASAGSLTSAAEFLKFCDRMNLSYSLLDLARFDVKIRECDLSLVSSETICDPGIFRNLILARLRQRANLTIACGTEVVSIAQKNGGYALQLLSTGTSSVLTCDAVVNCTYADINRLTDQLGYVITPHQFEYTVVPIVEATLPPVAVTVMDGPFMTLFPYGKSNKFLLYHVRQSVIKTEISHTVNSSWLDSEKSPFASLDKPIFFKEMRTACSTFVPALADAKLVGFLQSPRMVLANRDRDDARPSVIQNYGDGYLTVFSGKIDRSLDIADSVCDILQQHFEGQAERIGAQSE